MSNPTHGHQTSSTTMLNAVRDSTRVGTLEALSRFRFAVLDSVDSLLNGAVTPTKGSDTTDDLSRLLMSSLEELKVAEEELRAQNEALIDRQSTIDAQTRHYNQLFLALPVPTLITDLFCTIHEANVAAATLFRRDPDHLERKPLLTLIAEPSRAEFRKQLGRFSGQNGVRDWRLSIARHGDLPIDVHANVKLIPGLGPTGSGVLCWMFANPEAPSGAFPDP